MIIQITHSSKVIIVTLSPTIAIAGALSDSSVSTSVPDFICVELTQRFASETQNFRVRMVFTVIVHQLRPRSEQHFTLNITDGQILTWSGDHITQILVITGQERSISTVVVGWGSGGSETVFICCFESSEWSSDRTVQWRKHQMRHSSAIYWLRCDPGFVGNRAWWTGWCRWRQYFLSWNE